MNRSYRTVQEAAYPVVLAADPEARTEKGLDGVDYRVARAGGRADIPDGAYLVDPAGQVRYRVQEGIGSEKAPAPQATLMSLVTKGILTQQLPWGLVLLGVFTSILMEIIGVPALAFAVGMYLPLESTTPVFLGGLARKLVDRERGSDAESDAGPGVLFSSGLVAGGSIMGLFAVAPRVARSSRSGWARRFGFGNQALPGLGRLPRLPRRRLPDLPHRAARRRRDRRPTPPDPPRKHVKVAFIGTHGVGKTDAVLRPRGGAEARQGVAVDMVKEVARLSPLPINRKTSLDAQTWILMTQVAEEIRSRAYNDVVVCDRSALDNYAYMVLACGRQKPFERFVAHWMKTYDLLFKVPISGAASADGVRDTDEFFMRSIDAPRGQAARGDEGRARGAARRATGRSGSSRCGTWS